jgi:uncharacterized membrane protein
MGVRAPLIMSILIVAGMAALSAWAWPLIPDSAPIAIHWGLNNKPNGFASKEFALLVMPAAALFLTLLFAFLSRLSGAEALTRGATAYEVGWMGGLLVLAACHVLIVMAARGYHPDVAGNVSFAVGLLLTVIGNFLGRTRPNPFVGVRTFWSLRSDLAWDKSNRAAGRMFVATGLATLASLPIGGGKAATVVLLVGGTASALIAVALSYVYWKQDPERQA